MVERRYTNQDYDRDSHPHDEVVRAYAKHIAGVEIPGKLKDWWGNGKWRDEVGKRTNGIGELLDDTRRFWEEIEKIDPKLIPGENLEEILRKSKQEQSALAFSTLLSTIHNTELTSDLLPGEVLTAIHSWK